MARKVMYWATTGILAAMAAFAAFSYLTAAPDVVAGFTRVGYPQQLRVLLGVAKLSGAVALVVPGFPKLKEWAYAGFAFAWIAAAVAHYLAGERGTSLVPLVLLVFLSISYVTRPETRQLQARTTIA
jgi:hypothetical protein